MKKNDRYTEKELEMKENFKLGMIGVGVLMLVLMFPVLMGLLLAACIGWGVVR